MSTPINIIIDNETVLDDVEACEIKLAEEQYCSSVSLSMKSKTFWALCDPTTNFGTLRIKVVIGATTYQFLTEERDTTPTKTGVAFTVWGRSKQALLSQPYSKSINDTDTTTHPWQTGNTTASAIVAHVVSNYCPYAVTVNWNIANFAVYVDSFSVSNQFPIDVISALANVVGAELVAAADGSLSIETYSVAEGTSVESYNDLDDIVQLSESIDYPSGYNAVTVYGYGSGGGPSGDANAYIAAERQGTGPIYPGRYHTVRVYYYHSRGDTPTYSFPEGSCQLTGSGTESITEDVRLIFGKSNTSKTNTAGETSVTGDEDIPITTVSTTYSVRYRDYAVRADEIGTYNILFYFEDKSAYTVYSFTVVEAPGTDDEDPDDDDASIYCDGLVLEKASPTNVAVGDLVQLRLYNPMSIAVLKWANSGGAGVTFGGAGSQRSIIEDVLFTNGEATLSYPVLLTPTVQFKGVIAQHSVKHKRGSKILTVNAFVDVFQFYYVYATVTYTTGYDKYWLIVPSSYALSTFDVAAQMGSGCSIQTVSFSVDATGAGRRDITLNVKDNATEINVAGALIYVDGSWAGNTNSDGNLSLVGVSVGDHTLKITRSGYLDSDLDDLANDSFTVTAA